MSVKKDQKIFMQFRLGIDKRPEWFKEGENIEFVREKIIDAETLKVVPNAIVEIYIKSENGKQKVEYGDYIIKDKTGKIFACKENQLEKFTW